MANNLERQIEKGERVVVSANYMKDSHQKLALRIFVCDGTGFGASSFTKGNAVFGYWEYDGEKDRIEGYQINAKATETLQSTGKS